MRFMNEWDIEESLTRFDQILTPNRDNLAFTVSKLADWANDNSDGWCYWKKPLAAAQKAIALIDGGTWAERTAMESEDCTDAEFKAALTPIKRFLTTQGVPHSVVGL